ncbi:hypothetical protein SAMN04488112_12622 [Melghirimyces thermohalophilus]|uniref:Uncharacterized protein n=1 Tax=Melghirimyces thermohalophilus TaxID=1236220 RepID=A0A1G6R5J2_9BACL|nr:hypothetical protein [Melghirimyces thermohalophilus]SDC99909.1 hypothetical protein SAMN04488112_12622 [Melghirimyces thermohalophilus]
MNRHVAEENRNQARKNVYARIHQLAGQMEKRPNLPSQYIETELLGILADVRSMAFFEGQVESFFQVEKALTPDKEEK